MAAADETPGADVAPAELSELLADPEFYRTDPEAAERFRRIDERSLERLAAAARREIMPTRADLILGGLAMARSWVT